MVNDFNLPPGGRLTVREYYERFLAEKRSGLSRETLGSDWTAIRRWEKYARSSVKEWKPDAWGRMSWFECLDEHDRPVMIDNPPIGLVVDDDLADFQQRLRRDVAATTVNTTMRHLMSVFMLAAPRSPTHRHGRNDLLVMPSYVPLETVDTSNWIPTAAQVGQFITAANQAVWPVRQGVSAAAWWQALIVFLSNYGMRCNDWQRLERSTHGLHCPGPGCDPPSAEQGGRVTWVPHKTRRKRPDPVWLPLNEPTSILLKRIRTASTRKLFYSCTHAAQFRREWKRLLSLVGLEMTEKKSDGKDYLLFDRHALRRFCNVRLNEFDPQKRPGEWVLGHGIKGRAKVNALSYERIHEPPEYVQQAVMNAPQIAEVEELIATLS